MARTNKRGRKKNTLWNMLFAYSEVAFGIINGIILVPLYLKYVDVSLYGAWLASGNILMWLTVVDPGVSNIILQKVAFHFGSNDKEKVASFIYSGALLMFLIASFIVIVGCILSTSVPGMANFSGDGEHTLIVSFAIASIASGLMFFSFSLSMGLLGMQAAVMHGVVSVLANTLALVGSVVLLLAGGGLYAIPCGLLLRSMIRCIGCGYMLVVCAKKENIPFRPSFGALGEIFSLLTFTSLGKIGGLLARNTDALLLARFLGPELVPVYVLTRRGFTVAEMILNRSANAIAPSVSHLSGEGDSQKLSQILSRLLSINLWILGLAFAGFFALNDDFVRLWTDTEFFAGFYVSTVFCVLMVMSVIFPLMQTLCVSLGDFKHNAIAQFIQALVTFTALLLGVQYLGLLGAALAPVVGFATISVWYYPRKLSQLSFFQREDKQQLLSDAFVSLGFGLVIGLAGFLLPDFESWIEFIVAAGCIGIIYILVLYITRARVRKELHTLTQLIVRDFLSRPPIKAHG